MRGHFALAFSLFLACAAGSAEPIGPAAIHAQINVQGARATVELLYGTAEWSAIIKGVALGEEAWLEVAIELAPGSDAGGASELRDAVAWALPKAPTRVIAIAERSELFKNSCSGPAVDFPSDDSKSYFAAAIAAVQKISDPALKAAKATCLSKLRLASRA